MAVVVQCYHCNAILELDDGFRGGVCRCSTCGTLLKVPKGDPAPGTGRTARPAGPPAPAGPAKPPPASSASVDAGISSEALDPGRSGADLGGSSSGMGQVHRTRPISHTGKAKAKAKARAKAKAESRKPAKPDRGAKLSAALQEASDKEVSVAPSAQPEPFGTSAAKIPHGKTPRWLLILLLLATVGVIAGAVYLYVLQK